MKQTNTNKTIKKEKQDKVEVLYQKLNGAASSVFIDYSKMGVKAQQDLSRKIKSAGGTMLVAKNTLIRIAAQKASFPEESITDSVLSGQSAVVISHDDPISSIQTIGKFMAQNEFPKFKAGVVEGTFQNADSLMKLSKLPSKEVLYAQVVGRLSAPMYGLVGTLQANMQKLVWILKQKAAATN